MNCSLFLQNDSFSDKISAMLCDQFDDLSLDHKNLIFSAFSTLCDITISDKTAVKFERIGMNRGFNSAIHRVILDDNHSFAVKITNHEVNEIVNMLHNRELEFYEWMEKCKREDNDYPHDFSHLLTFYGGSECGKGPVFQIVKAIAGYQSVYLCTDNEVSVGKELIKFDLPVLHSRPKLDKNNWMTKEEKEYLKEWTQPKELFAIHTQIPEGVKDISAVLSHCDLWPGNMLFEQKGEKTCLLAFLDWQTFKIGNPLIDIASMIGLNMNTEDRKEHTEGILRLYVEEMEKTNSRFKKTFEITMEKARILLAHALRWACIELMFAILFSPDDDTKEEGEDMGRLSIRLRELMRDVLGREQ